MRDDVRVVRRVDLGAGSELDTAVAPLFSEAWAADAPRASLVELRLVGGIVTIGGFTKCLRE